MLFTADTTYNAVVTLLSFFFSSFFFYSLQILVGSSMGGWLMLLAAIARPDKTKALVGISTAADHLVTAFKSLPLQVGSAVAARRYV